MTTEPKNVLGSILSTLKSQTSSQTEIEQKIAERQKVETMQRGVEYLAKANIPALHRNLPASEIDGDGWKKLRDRVAAKLGSGFIIALTGHRGTGKTQLAVEILKSCARAGNRPFYCTAMGFFLDIKESFRSKGSEKAVIEAYVAPACLVIDEMQERGETPWEDRLLTHLIDRRYGAQKDTLIISNQTREKFLESIGESVSSRIIETGGVAVCDWPSYRSLT